MNLIGILARLLVLLGLLLIALGCQFTSPAPTKEIILSRRAYRRIERGPTQQESIRLGLAVLFNSVRFGLGV